MGAPQVETMPSKAHPTREEVTKEVNQAIARMRERLSDVDKTVSVSPLSRESVLQTDQAA